MRRTRDRSIDDQSHRKRGQLLGDGPFNPCDASHDVPIRRHKDCAHRKRLHGHGERCTSTIAPTMPNSCARQRPCWGRSVICGPGWVGVTETSWRLPEMSSRSSPDARLPAKVNRHAAHAQADCAVTGGVGVQDGAGAAASLAAVLIGCRTCNASPVALVHDEVPPGEGFVGVS